MGFWTKFINFITPPPPEVDEVKKAKVIKQAVKEATVTLKPLAKAITDGEVVPVVKKKVVRAKTKKGRYIADDKTTADFNEAWVGGKAPAKKPKAKKVKVKKKK